MRSRGEWLVLLVLTGVMIWVVWGVIVHAWFIPEIASQFFTMGVVIGLIGVIFRLNGMTVNVMASSFTEGARMMIAPALLVGFAKGILLLVGNGEAGEPSVLNDGFSHIIYPTSASLMATLGVCRVDFRNWLKVGASLLGLLFIMSSVVVIGAQMMGYH